METSFLLFSYEAHSVGANSVAAVILNEGPKITHSENSGTKRGFYTFTFCYNSNNTMRLVLICTLIYIYMFSFAAKLALSRCLWRR